MVLSVDDVVAKFSMKTMPKIDGEPDYGNINTMMQLLYDNHDSPEKFYFKRSPPSRLVKNLNNE